MRPSPSLTTTSLTVVARLVIVAESRDPVAAAREAYRALDRELERGHGQRLHLQQGGRREIGAPRDGWMMAERRR